MGETNFTINQYRQAGYVVFPLTSGVKATSKGEVKALNPPKGWAAITHGSPQDKYRVITGDYGVQVPDGVLVIDRDPRRETTNKNDFTALARYAEEHKQTLEPTFTVYTGGGGVHYYYRVPRGKRFISQLRKVYPELDFMGVGHFVVGPGSIHPVTRNEYRVLRGNPSDLADLPECLVKLLDRGEQVTTVTDFEPNDTPENREWYKNWLCRSAPVAIEGSGGDTCTYKVAAFARDKGLPEETAFELLWEHYNPRCLPPWDYGTLRHKVANAYRYAMQPFGVADYTNYLVPQTEAAYLDEKLALQHTALAYSVDKNGAIRNGMYQNIITMMLLPPYGEFINPLYDLVHLDTFEHKIRYVYPPPWAFDGRIRSDEFTESEASAFAYYLQQAKGFTCQPSDVWKAVQYVAARNPYHPVQSYLKSLKWDGRPRLDTWLPHIMDCDNTPYHRAVGVKLLCAMVARVMAPGCKFDHTPVLESPEGFNKDRFLRALAVKREWYNSVSFRKNDKDTHINTLGTWVSHFSELDGITGQDMVSAIKKYFTDETIKIRLPYDKTTSLIERQCVFVGSVNPGSDGAYLASQTGNRRFWPVAHGVIDVEGFLAVREQLFAEAFLRYPKEALWMETTALAHEAKEQVDMRTETDPWAASILDYLECNLGINRISTVDIARMVLGIPPERLNSKTAKRISDVLVAAGWSPTRTSRTSRPVYLRPGMVPENLDQLLVDYESWLVNLRRQLITPFYYSASDLWKLFQGDFTEDEVPRTLLTRLGKIHSGFCNPAKTRYTGKQRLLCLEPVGV